MNNPIVIMSAISEKLSPKRQIPKIHSIINHHFLKIRKDVACRKYNITYCKILEYANQLNLLIEILSLLIAICRGFYESRKRKSNI